MAIVQTLQGSAILVVGEERIEVTYEIEVHQIGHRKEMRGSLTGPQSSRPALLRAFSAPPVHLDAGPGLLLSVTPTEMAVLNRAPAFRFVAIPVLDGPG